MTVDISQISEILYIDMHVEIKKTACL